MQSFWRLMRYIKNYKGNIVASISANVLTALFTVVSIPLLIPFLNLLFLPKEQLIVQSQAEQQLNLMDVSTLEGWLNYQLSKMIVEQGQETALIYVCGAILIAFFFKNLFRYLAMFFMAPMRNGIIRDVRKQLFDKILDLPLPYFSEERKGDLMSRITADVQEIEWSILNVLEALFREPLILLGSLGFMLYISPGLTLFVFILILFTGVVIGGIGKSLRKPSGEVQSRLGNLVTIVEEALSGLRIIKGFNAEGYQEAKFATENNAYRHALTRLLWRKDLASPLSEFLGIATVAVLLWYGSRQVFGGNLEAGTFLAFIFAFYNVIEPAKSFSRAFYNVQKGIAAMNRVENVLDAPNIIQEKADAHPINSFNHNIEYDNVSFAYRKVDGPVVQHIDLTIEKGKVVALVGASGAGKSTLVDLLPRFYDVTDGAIRVDGIDIKDYRLKDLRSLMGIVSQEAILFNDSIYNNIVFGLEGVKKEEVERAARIANAHDFILQTEQGYQTNIGDRGNKLSGGQRQRLTIARAILKNPPILILDEATSALDSESEQLVQQSLLELMKDRTSIVIAHRLSTIQHADEIIVMRDGHIIERGSHTDLLEAGGEYQKLVQLQAF